LLFHLSIEIVVGVVTECHFGLVALEPGQAPSPTRRAPRPSIVLGSNVIPLGTILTPRPARAIVAVGSGEAWV
jgi:hypothetical protein